jgi:hypothetical protein
VGIVVVAVAGRRAVPIVTAVPVNAGVPIPLIVTGGPTIIGGIVIVPVNVGVPIPLIVTGGLTIIGGTGTGMPRANPGNVTLGDGGVTGWARG